MRVEQQKVRKFHEKHDLERADRPTLVARPVWRRRKRHMQEELDEYEAACEAGDRTEIADALADLAYTVLGTAVAHGIDLEPVFDEVHRSNMTKENLNRRGKGGKGKDYRPPFVAACLIRQLVPGFED